MTPTRELVWCSDGYERPDLRALLDQHAGEPTRSASRGSVETHERRAFPCSSRRCAGRDAQPLGSLVIELGGGNSRSTAVDGRRACCGRCSTASRASSISSQAPAAADRSAGLDLLLRADEHDREDASALQRLLAPLRERARCVTGALLVPDKNLEISCEPRRRRRAASQLLDRTQKHLLAWAQAQQSPDGRQSRRRSGGGRRTRSSRARCAIRTAACSASSRCSASADAEDFEPRDVRILEFVSRKAVAILDSEYDPLTGLPNRLIFERRAQTRRWTGRATALLYVDIDELADDQRSVRLERGRRGDSARRRR